MACADACLVRGEGQENKADQNGHDDYGQPEGADGERQRVGRQKTCHPLQQRQHGQAQRSPPGLMQRQENVPDAERETPDRGAVTQGHDQPSLAPAMI